MEEELQGVNTSGSIKKSYKLTKQFCEADL